MKKTICLAACLATMSVLPAAFAQSVTGLDAKQQSVVAIAALTSQGDVAKLEKALVQGLENGLSVNEIKEVLVQMYAYTGFPRSLNGINALMRTLDARQKSGIVDELGKDADPLPENFDRNTYGAQVRARLGGRTEVPPPSGYQVFAPTIDNYLKEHLFADIFARDVLDWQTRELATIGALSAMNQVQGQMRFHMSAAMNMGLSPAQMQSFIQTVLQTVGSDRADEAKAVLDQVLKARGTQNQNDSKTR